jgi:antirestriction protein ArdC
MKNEEIRKITEQSIQCLMESMRQGKSESLVQYLRLVSRFHHYSLHNVLLIALQKPSASYVAGFRTWNKLGRFVRKGEKGILILAPMLKTVANENACHRESETRRIVGFRSAYVFDVSQTDGAALPSLATVSGDPGVYATRLAQHAASQGISVAYSSEIAPARGVSMGGKILLLPGMTAAEEFATLAHEVAHELLHRGERRATTTKTVRETEAEAVAFVVCSAVHLETASASQDYIGLYNGDADLLLDSLEHIQRAGTSILKALHMDENSETQGAEG